MRIINFCWNQISIAIVLTIFLLLGCSGHKKETINQAKIPEPKYFLTRGQTHNKFSATIPPILTVPFGAIIEAMTEEASDEQIKMDSGIEDLTTMKSDPIHPLTGPV